MKHFLPKILLGFMFLGFFFEARAQENLTPGNSVSQNFDLIGTSATAALPANWKVSKGIPARIVNFAEVVSNTERIGGNSLATNAANGIYNFGAGAPNSAEDRAIGFLSSGTATQSGNLFFEGINAGDQAINSFEISYNVEKYRNGSNASGFSIRLFYSKDGENWTEATDFIKSFNSDSDNTGFANAPGVSETVSGTLQLSVAAGENVYFAWNYSVTTGNTTSNAQALAIDDIVIIPVASGGSTDPDPDPEPVAAANLPYSQNFSGFNFALNTPISSFGNQNEWSFSGAQLNYTGDFTNDNLTPGGFRGNNNVLAYQHTGTSGVLVKTLTLINNTGKNINSLDISYLGRVGRATQGRSPAYTVLVNGTEIPALAYSTLNSVDQRVSATVNGLNIAPNQIFTISWSSERGGPAGSSKVIGIAELSIRVTPEPEQILNYNFAGQPGNQAFTVPNFVSDGLAGLNFTRGSGINPASANNSISSNGWNEGENRFFSFGFTVAPGKLVDLSQLQIGTNASGTGPRDMALVYSGDNFTTPIATWTQPAAQFLNQTIDLSGLQNLSGTVEFRIVITSGISANNGTIGSGGTFRVTNYFEGGDTGGTRLIGIVKNGEGVIIPSISISPQTLDFGNLSLNAANPVLSYELTATNLIGNLTITAPTRLSVSKDANNFSESITFTAGELASVLPVFVKFDNSVAGGFSAQIIHSTSGTLPVSLQVNANVFDPFNIVEDFNSICLANLGPIAGGWNQISVQGDQTWSCSNFGRAGTTATASAPFGVQINGFAAGAARLNEDWLISPTYDLTGFDFPLLQFWSRVAFTGPRLKLLVSTDYVDGDPHLATWTELADRFAQGDVWTSSGDINLAAFKAPHVRIAFVYTSSPEASAARWTLDDFSLRNSQTAPAPFLTNNIGNVDYWHFGVIPVGTSSSEERTFTFSLSDGLTDLIISARDGFEFSKDGISYSPTLTFSPAEAAKTNTVRVRFQPNSEGAFSSPIKFKSGDIEVIRGYLTGATVERSNSLDVVTWNIEWFGSSLPNQGPTNIDLQLQNVKKVIEDLDADIYAFQEITNLDKFYELVAALPAYRGFHSPAVSGGGTFEEAQKLTFLYKTATIDSVSTRVLLQGVQPEQLVGYPSSPDRFWASGRLPFLFEAKATINGAEKKINFVNVHTRSNGGGESAGNPRYAMRRYDVNVLKDSLDRYYANIPLVILGDFNDDLDETVADQFAPTVNTSETSFINFINDRENYIPVTLNLSLAGLRTFPTFENVIDHIIISNELEENWMVNSERIVAPFDLIPNYSNTTSDHIPVKMRFSLFCDIIPAQIFGTTEVCGANSTAELMLVGGMYENILGWEISLDRGQTWALVEESAGKDVLRITDLTSSALFRAILDSESCAPVTTEAFEVEVTQLPQPVILFDRGMLISIEGNYTYYWYKDQELIATTTNNSIRINGAGNYQVVIEDERGCQASSVLFRFPQQIQASSIRIYPNPASSKVSVLMRNIQGPATVELRTGAGLQVARQTSSTGYAEFDVSGMMKGVFLIIITDRFGQTAVERLLVD
jgi:endonuclease/exonuclease/phosphatase family metal-dependent hydrolase